MRVAHVLRKYNPNEWGGQETALKNLTLGLRRLNVDSVIYCPECGQSFSQDPLLDAQATIKRYQACLPICGISTKQCQRLIAIGGNLMSFDLARQLWQEPKLSIIHSHVLHRIGGISHYVARLRKIPFIITIHGGVLDIPEEEKANLVKPLEGGWEWGKVFGFFLRSRHVLADADGIIVINKTEQKLLKRKYPNQRIEVIPHGIAAELYQQPYQEVAKASFPEIQNKELFLVVGRIDTQKNQLWLVQQMHSILKRHPNVCLCLVGSTTNQEYEAKLTESIRELNLEKNVYLLGGMLPHDPKLIGLYQIATAVIIPSISEPFGLVVLEAWASGRVVISSRTSGPSELIQQGQNGWLFDLERLETFHEVLDKTVSNKQLSLEMGRAGQELVAREYEYDQVGKKMYDFYESLVMGSRP